MKKLLTCVVLVALLAACSQQATPSSNLEAQKIGTSAYDEFWAVSSNGPHLYVGGSTSGSLAAPLQGQIDGLLRKYDGFSAIWTKQFGQPSAITNVWNVLANADGSAYIVGEQLNYPSPFIAKYDRFGNRLWLKTFASSGRILFTGYKEIPHDAQGNMYVQVLNQNKAVINVLKFNLAGELLQTIFVDQPISPTASNGVGFSSEIAVDPAGNLYAAFSAYRPYSSTDPRLQPDVILKRFNNQGQRTLTKTMCGGTDYNFTRDIVADNVGNVYLSCLTYISDLGGAASDKLYKLNSSGTVLWSSDVSAIHLAVDAQNNLYGTSFTNCCGAYIDKFDPNNGSILWQTFFGNTDPRVESPTSIVVTDQVYVAGIATETSASDRDPFLLKIRKTDGRILQIDR